MMRAHISRGGPTRTIAVRGTVFRFEDHPQCGPIVVGKNDDVIAQPKDRHEFWRIVSLWYQQGKQIVNGMCVWAEPKQPKIEHIGGRHWRVVPDGDRP